MPRQGAAAMDMSTTAPVFPGEILAGKYRVERVLGAGGIGVVVAATHLQLDRQVALKFLLPEIASNREIVARFSREARAAAKLRSEHVTQVLDVGELRPGVPYMVMEYLEGCDLARLLRARGPLPLSDAVAYVLEAGEAIAEAHAAGVIHRDLKPANLFVTTGADGYPRIKVLDFGISKSLSLESVQAVSLTSSSAVIGTPLYMSPEQMQSARGVDERTDLWSLGAILYELLAGRPPFLATSLPQLCIAVMQQDPDPVRRYRPEVPAGLEAVIARCLAKNRDQRYRTVSELAAALVPFGPPEAGGSARRIASTSGLGHAIPPTAPAPSGLGSSGMGVSGGQKGPASPTVLDTSGASFATATSHGGTGTIQPLRKHLPGLLAALLLGGTGFLLVLGALVFVGYRSATALLAETPSSQAAGESEPALPTVPVPARAVRETEEPSVTASPSVEDPPPAASASSSTRREGPPWRRKPRPGPSISPPGPATPDAGQTSESVAPGDLMTDRE